MVDHPQVSKGVQPKAKLILKQLKTTRQRCTDSVYPNECAIVKRWGWLYHGIIVKPTHEQNVSKLDTCAPGENWHTQKWQCFVHPTLQGEQNVQDKIPPTNFIIELITFFLPNKKPKTTPNLWHKWWDVLQRVKMCGFLAPKSLLITPSLD